MEPWDTIWKLAAGAAFGQVLRVVVDRKRRRSAVTSIRFAVGSHDYDESHQIKEVVHAELTYLGGWLADTDSGLRCIMRIGIDSQPPSAGHWDGQELPRGDTTLLAAIATLELAQPVTVPLAAFIDGIGTAPVVFDRPMLRGEAKVITAGEHVITVYIRCGRYEVQQDYNLTVKHGEGKRLLVLLSGGSRFNTVRIPEPWWVPLVRWLLP